MKTVTMNDSRLNLTHSFADKSDRAHDVAMTYPHAMRGHALEKSGRFSELSCWAENARVGSSRRVVVGGTLYVATISR